MSEATTVLVKNDGKVVIDNGVGDADEFANAHLALFFLIGWTCGKPRPIVVVEEEDADGGGGSPTGDTKEGDRSQSPLSGPDTAAAVSARYPCTGR